jgi:non-specific protein-tyrosine kinase
LLVTSSRAGEGKTTTALNLAATMALAGLRVVLVDANLRRPRLHALLACANRSGLTTWLRDEQTDLVAALLPVGHANLRLLPAGPATVNPCQLLLTPRMATLADALAGHADVVLIDGPALLTSAEGPLLARCAEATLLVVRHGATPTETVAEALAELDGGLTLVGALLNQTPRSGGRGRNQRAPALDESAHTPAAARTAQEPTP